MKRDNGPSIRLYNQLHAHIKSRKYFVPTFSWSQHFNCKNLTTMSVNILLLTFSKVLASDVAGTPLRPLGEATLTWTRYTTRLAGLGTKRQTHRSKHTGGSIFIVRRTHGYRLISNTNISTGFMSCFARYARLPTAVIGM